ncbi:hypothetical protein J1N35_010141 [Gossypium stocksii]|uniref:Putative plant transposon protein domain-containing protein n=1 Tax=Gossypium stocksii TaxID=47602 RepID=A0A9D3W1D9_9ROSI|nr:hypothetical protein J1N35_010141 [Gossypium stocksii]
MPNSHSSTISMERMLLLYAILIEKSINIRKIILKEIYDYAKMTKGSAYFPALITSLCLRARVKTQANLRGQYVQWCITIHDLERLVGRVQELNQESEEEESEIELAGPNPAEGATNPEPKVEPEEEPVKPSVEPEFATPIPTHASTSKKSELSIMMDMCKFMHKQQQTYWKYAKIRDDSIRNTFKNIFNTFVPEFPNDIFETWTEESDDTSEDGA